MFAWSVVIACCFMLVVTGNLWFFVPILAAMIAAGIVENKGEAK